MLQRIKLQTRDGIREYPLLPTAAAIQAAADAGEIAVGDEVVYREYLVKVLGDNQLLVLERICGIPFGMPPFPGAGGAGGADWQFTVNGVQINPEQFTNMGGQQV